MKKQSYLFICILCFICTTVYATNTVIQYIGGGQNSTGSGSYFSQDIRTLGNGDLNYMNEGNNTGSIDDYFTGYYYDSAYGVFDIDTYDNKNTATLSDDTGSKVQVSSTFITNCSDNISHQGYKLEGLSFSENFGFMNFQYSPSIYTYICIPKDRNDSSLSIYLGGYAYSEFIGFQNFDGIIVSADQTIFSASEGRRLKVEGTVSTQNSGETISNQFTDDIRILGKLEKSTLKKGIHKKIFSVIGGITPTNGGLKVTGLDDPTWTSIDGKVLYNGKVLYFGNLSGEDVIISGDNNIAGNKTLVVEGGDIYIKGNIRGSGMLGIIALKKDGKGGNIYIKPTVTDIHAMMFADKSLLSYDGNELDGSTQPSELANQLYLYGSIFSENTIGGSVNNICPYYITTLCNSDLAKKYDLNFLRRYALVQPVDGDGNPVGVKIPNYGGTESYLGDNSTSNTDIQKPGYRKFPIIIEYNPKIQKEPPIFFD